MADRIPNSFIDELVGRVDIVEVIDRSVPLTRKGREYLACCPFHDEKTPSFTVSPVKQFYYCFGCGASGTAIGFLMDYSNLSFLEAVEVLADSVGLAIPREPGSSPKQADPPMQLLEIVGQANQWFQHQLRKHPDADTAVSYLKSRGLVGEMAASFGIGFAPDSWNALTNALGRSLQQREQMAKAGLVAQKDPDGVAGDRGVYDRFRGRIIFPIEDYRGRVVGFGGRIIGDGEPKYLNSPETPLFHKGAELYALHRARKEIGIRQRSLVVEGYMDVVGLAQYGIDYAVATLGTATTRTHLQRLFRLAPEIIFCFDGDRAGRSAAWKALQVALPEMHDKRQIGFLFLPDGEDPDTIVRSEGGDAFQARVDNRTPFSDFLLDHLTRQVDMNHLDGKAKLVSLALPLVSQLPDSVMKEMMFARLSALSGLTEIQLKKARSANLVPSRAAGRKAGPGPDSGQISPLASATSLLLQNPALGALVADMDELRRIKMPGSEILVGMIGLCKGKEGQTTARLLEAFRDSPHHEYLERLAVRANLIDEDALESQFKDTISRLLENQAAQHRMALLEKARRNMLDPAEKEELARLLQARAKP
ncbi:MAG: DNA primase [Gammaproteobacteria bacterium]|nr:DNA primase [Gammaproteobacteria bacterium]